MNLLDGSQVSLFICSLHVLEFRKHHHFKHCMEKFKLEAQGKLATLCLDSNIQDIPWMCWPIHHWFQGGN